MKRLNVNKNGNKKLINNDRVRWLIWNLPAVITCPNATPHCIASCYARKAEKQYKKNCLPSRERNFIESVSPEFVENMIYTIDCILTRGRAYKGKKVIFRIHESGDFYSREYLEKWLTIARYFVDNSQIVFMAYTKSLDFFEGLNVPENFVVRASLWDDTTEDQRAKMAALPVYTAVNSFDDTTTDNAHEAITTGKIYRCRCEDCAHCLACLNSKIKNIACEIH